MRAIILKTAGYPVRIRIVKADGVELGKRQKIGMIPVFASIIREPNAMVIAYDDMIGIARVNPEGVIIAAKTQRLSFPGFAAVISSPRSSAEDMNYLIVIWINDYFAVVITGVASNALAIRAYLPPGFPAIIGSVNFPSDHAF